MFACLCSFALFACSILLALLVISARLLVQRIIPVRPGRSLEAFGAPCSASSFGAWGKAVIKVLGQRLVLLFFEAPRICQRKRATLLSRGAAFLVFEHFSGVHENGGMRTALRPTKSRQGAGRAPLPSRTRGRPLVVLLLPI